MSQSLAAPTVGSAHFKLFLTSVLWGATWPAGRVVATHMPPVASASWRFSLAAILMLWLLRSRLGYWPRLTLRQYVWLGLCGAVGVLGYMICFMWGLSLVTAGRGSLVIALNPVVTALGAAWLLRERITPRMMLGMLLATVGALIVISHGEMQRLLLGDIGKGEIVLLGCVLCWAAYSLMSKVSMRFTDSLTATCYPIAIGTVLLLFLGSAIDTHIVHYAPAQPFDVTQVAWQVWGSLIFLSLGATVLAYLWFFEGVDKLGATTASAYNTLVPVFGVLFSWALLGERTDWSLLVGGGIAIGGIMLMNWTRKKVLAVTV